LCHQQAKRGNVLVDAVDRVDDFLGEKDADDREEFKKLDREVEDRIL